MLWTDVEVEIEVEISLEHCRSHRIRGPLREIKLSLVHDMHVSFVSCMTVVPSVA